MLNNLQNMHHINYLTIKLRIPMNLSVTAPTPYTSKDIYYSPQIKQPSAQSPLGVNLQAHSW